MSARKTLASADSTTAIGLEESRRHCKRLATSHYENFIVSSILLPRRLRQPFYNIYAFCRTADDVADESPNAEVALAGLKFLQNHVDAMFDNLRSPEFEAADSRPDASLIFPALADTAATYGLKKQPFDDLLSAFRQDQEKAEYLNETDLLDYCRRSANPVGRMILQLADCCDDKNAALSDEICTGLQLVNFWQDVSRDHAIGRIYLPREEREAFGVEADCLAANSTPTALRDLLRDLCHRAEAYFHRGLPLAQRVPRWLSSDIKLFAHGGLATIAAIRRIDFDCLRVRPRVSKATQLGLMARAAMGLL
ncbi:MAG: squalene synthase HpnC [Planctomycetota bacterium]